ncbi:hypothetical protein V1L52_01100 [Treponema sp. HNW]|uniref:hypothetical protein n=1 Tax=Treponema sp. HNW TaxID=3116654 RepID=UPI003D0ED014
MKQSRTLFIYVVLFCTFCAGLSAQNVQTNLPLASLAVFRDAMYNNPLNHDELLQLYEKTMQDIASSLSDYDLYVASARCDYYMGRSYGYAQNKEKAGFYYDRALETIQKALSIKEGPEALLIQGENISQNCAVKPVSYAMSNGLKVGKLAQQVIDADPKNGAAMHLLHARHVYAPSPFHNHRKGIKEMKRILEIPGIKLENDDTFNITSAIAYAYIQLEKYKDALEWIEKALAVYPSNFFALDLKKQAETKEQSL